LQRKNALAMNAGATNLDAAGRCGHFLGLA
jgi:hypothetical protein